MSVINGINKILNSKSTSIAVFGLTGVAKVASDYYSAPEEEKKSILVRDTIILGGSAVGLALYSKGKTNFVNTRLRKFSSKVIDESFDKLKQNRFINSVENFLGTNKKHAESAVKNIYNITKDCCDNTMMVASGILGAIGADYFIQMAHLNKLLFNPTSLNNNSSSTTHSKEDENNTLDNSINSFENFKNKVKNNALTGDLRQIKDIVDEDTQNNIISNITNLPEMKVFTSSMIGIQGLEIAREKTFKDKLKHTTKNLITNTLIPIFYLSVASNITKSMKGFWRLPIVFSSMVAGTMYTNRKLESKLTKFDTSS